MDFQSLLIGATLGATTLATGKLVWNEFKQAQLERIKANHQAHTDAFQAGVVKGLAQARMQRLEQAPTLPPKPLTLTVTHQTQPNELVGGDVILRGSQRGTVN